MIETWSIEELANSICDIEYTGKNYEGKTETKKLVNRWDGNKTVIKAAVIAKIHDWLGKQETELETRRKIGELEAKVYAYEKIISNSNFAPVVVREVEPKATPDISKMAEMVVDGFPEED